MEKTDPSNSTLRFGVFEVDPRSGELRKAGLRVRVEHQPFRVLLALLESPGEVVTREELRRRIWPRESFGDFDHAVNKAVAKLRTALGDSADVPRYVETLHRRGYRFVFPMRPTNGHETAPPAEAESSFASSRGTEFANIKPAWAWAAVTVLAVVVIAAVGFSFRNKTPKLTTRDTIVLADFVNTTGDPVFDGALKQALAVELGQSPFLNVLSDERLRLASDDVLNYSNLAFAYLLSNKLDEAKATLHEAFAHNLDGRELRWEVYQVAFLQDDTVQMDRELAWATGRPGAEDTLLYAQSDTEAFYGLVKKAREFNRRAVDSALRTDSSERAALWLANAALWEAELGNAVFARHDVAVALALSPGRNVKMWAALALARAGDGSHAQVLAEELEKNNPTYTMLNVLWLPTIKATIDLARGNPSNALVDLQPTIPYELSNNLNLLPAYLRGRAYLLLHDGVGAVAEFQKVLEHRGIVRNAVQGTLVRLQMARAYAMLGDIAKARAEYEDFLAVWKGADPDIPVLKEAKAEYARLH